MLDPTAAVPALRGLITMHRAYFKALSEAWMDSGAQSFGVYGPDGDALLQWPVGASPISPGRDVVCAPVRVGSVIVGELRVLGRDLGHLRERLEADATAATRIVGMETELQAMTAELVAANDQILALYRLARSVRGELNIDATLDILSREAAVLSEVGVACIAIYHGGTYRITQYPPDSVLRADIVDVFDRLRAEGQEILVSNPDILPDGVDNAFISPIAIRGDVIAGIGWLNRPGGFVSPDLKLARAIAEEAGAQIEKVLLYHETLEQARFKTELDLAADIQSRLLPLDLPSIPGLDIAAASVQARQVGGDFYDMVWQFDLPLTFSVGDVAGKGMSSALLMAMTRTVFRSSAKRAATLRASDMLTLANHDLYDDFTRVSRFITAFVGRYDPATRHLDYANAGQSPVIWRPADGAATLMPAADMPIGVLPDVEYETAALDLCPGDLLILATDGFSEARGKDGDAMFGYDRLLALVDAHAGEPAADIVTRLFDAVTAFSAGSPQDDDQTLMVIKAV
jgi:sigma-B regulation protein RsbU (phosphoserine phosphatase)